MRLPLVAALTLFGGIGGCSIAERVAPYERYTPPFEFVAMGGAVSGLILSYALIRTFPKLKHRAGRHPER